MNDVEQNSSTSDIVRSGLAVTPGVFMSTRNALMPRDPGSPVLASTTQRVACWAKLVHSFSPLINHPSPCWIAVVRNDPRSLPASGSENPWHQNSSPRRSRGKISSISSGRPNSAAAGPSTSCIDQDAVCTKARPVSSSPSTARRIGEPPNPTKAFRPSPTHPAGIEKHPLDAALVIKLRGYAAISERGDELIAARVDPVPHACTEIVHLHVNAPFSGLDEPGCGVRLDDRVLELVGKGRLRRPRMGVVADGQPE